jgi:hypothetical protein
VPAVIPPAGRPRSLLRGRAEAIPLPLAVPPDQPGAVYGLGRLDASGRVTDRAVLAALGWRAGDRLTLTASGGVMVARRDCDGVTTVPARPYLVIPAAVRQRCGLAAGDRVLLAAWPDQDTLAAYALALVEQAIRAHGRLPGGAGTRP